MFKDITTVIIALNVRIALINPHAIKYAIFLKSKVNPLVIKYAKIFGVTKLSMFSKKSIAFLSETL